MLSEKAIPLAGIQPAARWLVLDIETGNAPVEAIQVAIEAWKPPANIKDETKIEARRKEAVQKIREKAALLDASPILCVAAIADGYAPAIFNGMDTNTYPVEGWSVIGAGNEARMLEILRNFLDTTTTPETILVGHNLRAFDLPKLRHAYIRNRLRLPECLKPRFGDEARAETADTMALFKAYSMEHRDDYAVSLDTVAAALGIPRPKQLIDGSQIPALHEAGRYHEILTYCAIDTATTARAWELMAGFAEDLR